MMKKLLCIAGLLTAMGTVFAADTDTDFFFLVSSEVKQYNGMRVNLGVSNSETIASVKRKLLKKLGLSRTEHELALFQDRMGRLSDDVTVSEIPMNRITAFISLRSEPLLESELDTAYIYFQNLSDQEISTLSDEDMQQVFELQGRLIEIVRQRYVQEV